MRVKQERWLSLSTKKPPCIGKELTDPVSRTRIFCPEANSRRTLDSFLLLLVLLFDEVSREEYTGCDSEFRDRIQLTGDTISGLVTQFLVSVEFGHCRIRTVKLIRMVYHGTERKRNC